MLVAAVSALAVLAIVLVLALARTDEAPSSVKLGKGIASVETQPVGVYTAPAPVGVVPAGPSGPEATPSPIGAGQASYYGTELEGRPTASGERFDPRALTAAHRTLPLGSKVRVTNARTGDSVIVRINDRGPFHAQRVIDLSHGAARAIGLLRTGTGRVRLALMVS